MTTLSHVLTGFRLFAGETLNTIIDAVNTNTNKLAGTGSATLNSPTTTGLQVQTPTIVAAAGATQGGATQITTSRVIVTVTASTEGVKLPTAATGKLVYINVGGTVGVKVYPFTNDKISTASTNVAVALAADKGNVYIAKDATTWLVTKGA